MTTKVTTSMNDVIRLQSNEFLVSQQTKKNEFLYWLARMAIQNCYRVHPLHSFLIPWFSSAFGFCLYSQLQESKNGSQTFFPFSRKSFFFSKSNYIKQNTWGCQSIPEDLTTEKSSLATPNEKSLNLSCILTSCKGQGG